MEGRYKAGQGGESISQGKTIEKVMSVAANPQYAQSDAKDTDWVGNTKNTRTLPVSDIDLEFLSRISRTLEDIKLTKVRCEGMVPGSESNELDRPKSRYGSSKEIQTAMAEKKKNHQRKEEKREKVLLDKEKDLWENENWRDRVKDLSSSFSKLNPIDEGKKIVTGRGQAFVVDLDLLEDF